VRPDEDALPGDGGDDSPDLPEAADEAGLDQMPETVEGVDSADTDGPSDRPEDPEEFVEDDGDGGEGVPEADVPAEAGSCPPGMALVPPGPFVMGSDVEEMPPGGGDSPEHVVFLSGYCIDLTEVTNAEWRACAAAGSCPEPASADSYRWADYYTHPGFADFPVIHVDWSMAATYCTWAGKRLPTEAEWEKGARGGCEIVAPETCGPEDERTYPWGDADPTCDHANFFEGCSDPVGDTWEVGGYRAGDGPYGEHDLAGNVHEWVADWYDPDYYSTCGAACEDPAGPPSGDRRIHRGGGWTSSAAHLGVAVRWAAVPTVEGYDLGFRCALTP
jgi:formylglycine-generating enzyme required for sulfatase activity